MKESLTNDNNLISIGEAAKLMGMSIMTLRRWDKSGRFVSVRKDKKGYRYYRKEDIEVFSSDLFNIAYNWVILGKKISDQFYCQTSDVFQARLIKMQNAMIQDKRLGNMFSLIVSMSGEIGNNSFDHNLGYWPDLPGIFFGYDLNKKQIVLADRGLGVLETLKKARPSLSSYKQALRVAFTEIVSGRSPENRGNGLKYVKDVIAKNPINLFFQSGDAQLKLKGGSSELKINNVLENFCGCLALISY